MLRCAPARSDQDQSSPWRVTQFHVCMAASKKYDSKKVKEPQWKRLEKVSD